MSKKVKVEGEGEERKSVISDGEMIFTKTVCNQFSNKDALSFVPIQKMTLGAIAIAIDFRCEGCGRNCERCVIHTAREKIIIALASPVVKKGGAK